jgi:hypothetical protein
MNVPTFDGTCNWWGDTSGPSGAGPGSGTSVSADVTFTPWLEDPDLDSPCALPGLTVVKTVLGPAPGADWSFSIAEQGRNFTLPAAGGSTTLTDLAPGTITLAEIPVAGYHTEVSCSNGVSGESGETSVELTLGFNEDITCTFTNTALGTIIVEKQTVPDGAGPFNFSGAVAGPIGDGGQLVATNVTPGAHTVTEDPAPGFTLTDITCDDDDSATPSTGDVTARTATFQVDPGEIVTCFFTNSESSGSAPRILISSNKNGKVSGLSFRDEDIIAYDPDSDSWSLVFDGSDVGLGNVDVDAFGFLPDGRLLLSVDKDFKLNKTLPVDDSDILVFTPTSLGPTTSGSFQIYFDGSDVGLSDSGEDIDAIDFDQNGALVVSVTGSFKAPGTSGNVSGADEDLFVLNNGVLGPATTGTWALYFDGSDVGLTSSKEDLNSLWIDHANSKLYFSSLDDYSLPGGLKGNEDDIIVCTYGSLGATTSCTFERFWDGDHDHDFDEDAIDGLSIGAPPNVVFAAADPSGVVAVDDTVESLGDDADDPNELDGEESVEEEAQDDRFFLPIVTR